MRRSFRIVALMATRNSVGSSVLGAAIGLMLAIAWVLALDVVSREVGRGLEAVLGDQGLLVAGGVALVVIGAVLVVRVLGRRPGPGRGLGRWLLGFAVSAATLIAGVAVIASAF